MRIKHKKNLIPYIAIITLIAAIAMGYYFFIYTPSSTGTASQNNNPTTDVSKNNSSTTTTGNNNVTPVDKTPKQFEPPVSTEPANSPNNLLITVNTIINENTLYIRTTISELLGAGSCTLTLSNKPNSKPITLTSKIINSASTSSCDGWDIPLNTLNSGTWQLRIDVTSGNQSGNVSREVNI